MPFFVAGLFVGALIGGFVASLFAVSARERGIDDADALADELARDKSSSATSPDRTVSE